MARARSAKKRFIAKTNPFPPGAPFPKVVFPENEPILAVSRAEPLLVLPMTDGGTAKRVPPYKRKPAGIWIHAFAGMTSFGVAV